jgi:hypothetical protein
MMQDTKGHIVAETVDRLQIPLLLLTIAFFLMVGFQTVQLVRERGNLYDIQLGQETTVQESLKLRQQMESLATKTAQLAEGGNAGAKAIIEELRRLGITVKPNP